MCLVCRFLSGVGEPSGITYKASPPLLINRNMTKTVVIELRPQRYPPATRDFGLARKAPEPLLFMKSRC